MKKQTQNETAKQPKKMESILTERYQKAAGFAHLALKEQHRILIEGADALSKIPNYIINRNLRQNE